MVKAIDEALAGITHPDIFRLVYVSRVRLQDGQSMEGMMHDILSAADRYNRLHGLTGLLLSNGLWFVQALEGVQEDVETCFRRIEPDPRHSHLKMRMRGRARMRLFDRWSMCGLTLSPLDDALLRYPDIGFDVWRAPPEAVVQMLLSLARAYGPRLDAAHAQLRREARG